MQPDNPKMGDWAKNAQGNPPSHYKFTGNERDTETAFDYFGARYYVSSNGRWLNPDWADGPATITYADLSNPQSLNLYGYVDNNPMVHTDVNGHLLGGPGGVLGAGSAAAEAQYEEDIGRRQQWRRQWQARTGATAEWLASVL